MAFTTVIDKSTGDTFTEVMWDTYLKDNLNWLKTDHVDLAAAVHGLPASVNVLGSRSASGEFVQHGQDASTANFSAQTQSVETGNSTATFAVAFAVAPRVVATVIDEVATGVGLDSVTTTGFSYRIFGYNNGGGACTIDYIALGT